jgi:magnesium transporter
MRVWEQLDSHKETIESLQQANDSMVSNRTNKVIKILTIFTAVILPLTLITSLFSMHTAYLPIIGSGYDFWLVVGAMFACAIIMLIVFRKKKWL